MNKKVIGYIIAALLIGSMIVIMVNQNMNKIEPIDTSGVLVETGAGSEVAMEDVGLRQGDLPPDFELVTLSGETVKLSDLKGKKVILNFWATWCPPCKAEMPHMQNYYRNSAEDDNVEILAVNLTTGEHRGVKAVQEFADSYGLTFPIPLDETGVVGESYQAFRIPTTYLLNTDGTIAQVIIGPMDESMMAGLVRDLD
ncbi:redoxin domain-containing protein [Sporosarcina highlanderae]|uniref:Redoxin domain-containing protein n=1 Tax=Sporosarcina highlanderae TaxID=3035916 RepID=A0ABT8JPV1_9BACL|nr:redoxin domain-containing protein [Sporosarcina highlanderae]MDN4606838.1 redoxin domain-containing protein [Sporosarcina highlanderae]